MIIRGTIARHTNHTKITCSIYDSLGFPLGFTRNRDLLPHLYTSIESKDYDKLLIVYFLVMFMITLQQVIILFIHSYYNYNNIIIDIAIQSFYLRLSLSNSLTIVSQNIRSNQKYKMAHYCFPWTNRIFQSLFSARAKSTANVNY